MTTEHNTETEADDRGIPNDVQEAIDSDTKATSRDRFRKLLRDTYYAGPLPRGSSPERSTGANTSSPGSNLRRSRDGALWNLTQKQETLLLSEATDLGLIAEHNGQYFTTQRGVDTLKALDTCSDCGTVRQPHYEERTVQISRYSASKNHSLVTKCPDCDDGATNWDRDEFPMTNSNTDDAERLSRSIEDAVLYDAGIGEWMEPERRALQDFVEKLEENQYDGLNRFLTRYSTPRNLPSGADALRFVFNNYSTDVCSDFASLLLKTYYGACLTDVEREIVKHAAAGFPETGTDRRKQHAEDYMEPLAVIEGDTWEATLRFEATGNYVTISGTADGTASNVEAKTSSGFTISASSTNIGRVHAYPKPDELHLRDAGDMATVVEFEVIDEDSYPNQTRVEQAFHSFQKSVDTDARQARMKTKKTFSDIISGHLVNSSSFSNGTKHELNNTEAVELARLIREEVDEDDVPALVQRYAERELQ